MRPITTIALLSALLGAAAIAPVIIPQTIGGSQTGTMFPTTAPVNSDFSWVNQSTGTITATAYGLVLVGEAVNNSNDAQLRVKTAPGTPYHVEVGFTFPSTNGGSGAQDCGPVWRESGSGKFVSAHIQYTSTSGQKMEVLRWNSPSSASTADFTQSVNGMGSPFWIRIGDNGTNRTADFSADGQTWINVNSIARTTFITADQVGFYCTDSTNHAPVMTVISWKQTS